MSKQATISLIVKVLKHIDVNDPMFDWFRGTEEGAEVKKWIRFVKAAEDYGVSSIEMARICIYLANPTFVNCCDSLLEGLED